jgi:hypothetical protein
MIKLFLRGHSCVNKSVRMMYLIKTCSRLCFLVTEHKVFKVYAAPPVTSGQYSIGHHQFLTVHRAMTLLIDYLNKLQFNMPIISTNISSCSCTIAVQGW